MDPNRPTEADCGEDDDELAGAPLESLSAAQVEHLRSCAACRARRQMEARDSALFAELKGVTRRTDGPPSIPGYRLEGELRRGGQGIVYLAVQESTQRTVALKILSGRHVGARERRRFEREVELGSKLHHPGIVTVFDSGVSDGLPWYAMERIAGEPLDEFIARSPLPLEGRLRLFLELCAAVAHAHRSGVIHRDLKPGNVLVDETGHVRVLDFGTALTAAASRLTAPGEFLGTLAYASPEQVSAGPESSDTRSDVYSLGVVLYELVTGALPLDTDGSLADALQRILQAAPTPPERHVPGLDADLALILTTALEKERERRYPSVEALARDVEHLLEHEPIEARPRSAGYVLAKALRRHRRAALAAGALVLLGTLFLGALTRERLLARRAGENATLVRAVFQDILGAAAPGRMGGDAPLRDVLALAAREIEKTLEDVPDIQAAVQLTIGDTYRRLLMHSEAEGHLRLALDRYRSVEDAELETAHCLELYGQALAAQTKPEAIAAQEEALAIRRRLLPQDDARIAASERALARALMAQVRGADVERARALLEAARDRFRRALGPDHVEVAETELESARLGNWNHEHIEERLVAALALLERQAEEAPRDPRLIDGLTEYAAFLRFRQRYDEAEDKLARALTLTRELYGDELTSEILRRQALLAQERGEFERATELSRHALAFELRRWATNRGGERVEIEEVATALEAPGEPPFVAAFALLRRFRGEGAFELASWSNALARCLETLEHDASAEGVLREALNVHCRAWGAECPVRADTLLQLGELLARAERGSEAVVFLEEGLAIAQLHGRTGETERARAALALCEAPSERP